MHHESYSKREVRETDEFRQSMVVYAAKWPSRAELRTTIIAYERWPRSRTTGSEHLRISLDS